MKIQKILKWRKERNIGENEKVCVKENDNINV